MMHYEPVEGQLARREAAMAAPVAETPRRYSSSDLTSLAAGWWTDDTQRLGAPGSFNFFAGGAQRAIVGAEAELPPLGLLPESDSGMRLGGGGPCQAPRAPEHQSSEAQYEPILQRAGTWPCTLAASGRSASQQVRCHAAGFASRARALALAEMNACIGAAPTLHAPVEPLLLGDASCQGASLHLSRCDETCGAPLS